MWIDATKTTIVFICAASLFPLFSSAEPLVKKKLGKPVSWVTYTYESPADFSAAGYIPADKPGDTPSVTLNEVQAGVSTPLYISKSFQLMSGLNFAWHDFRFSAVELDNIDTYDITVPFTAIVPVNETWSVMANLSPGIHSDLQRVNHNDVSLGSMLLLNYTWSPSLRLSGGIVYSRIFGEERYFPAAGLDWQPSDSWSVRLMFPAPGVTYYISPKSRIGFGVGPAGGNWNIEDPRTINNDQSEYNFEFKGWRLGLSYEYDLTDQFTLLVDAGTTLRREYTIENDDVTLLDSDVDDTYGFRVGLLIRRPQRKPD